MKHQSLVHRYIRITCMYLHVMNTCGQLPQSNNHYFQQEQKFSMIVCIVYEVVIDNGSKWLNKLCHILIDVMTTMLQIISNQHRAVCWLILVRLAVFTAECLQQLLCSTTTVSRNIDFVGCKGNCAMFIVSRMKCYLLSFWL